MVRSLHVGDVQWFERGYCGGHLTFIAKDEELRILYEILNVTVMMNVTVERTEMRDLSTSHRPSVHVFHERQSVFWLAEFIVNCLLSNGILRMFFGGMLNKMSDFLYTNPCDLPCGRITHSKDALVVFKLPRVVQKCSTSSLCNYVAVQTSRLGFSLAYTIDCSLVFLRSAVIIQKSVI